MKDWRAGSRPKPSHPPRDEVDSEWGRNEEQRRQVGLDSATMVPELALRLWPSVGAFLAVYKNVHISCPRVNENLSLINIIATWMVRMSSHNPVWT